MRITTRGLLHRTQACNCDRQLLWQPRADGRAASSYTGMRSDSAVCPVGLLNAARAMVSEWVLQPEHVRESCVCWWWWKSINEGLSLRVNNSSKKSATSKRQQRHYAFFTFGLFPRTKNFCGIRKVTSLERTLAFALHF